MHTYLTDCFDTESLFSLREIVLEGVAKLLEDDEALSRLALQLERTSAIDLGEITQSVELLPRVQMVQNGVLMIVHFLILGDLCHHFLPLTVLNDIDAAECSLFLMFLSNDELLL